ncbi:hypothetical protein L9F63_024339 [Diploptera punctata]|uniref:Uncharacterized protein n=1 Tax=Diploptera punctata TaxID=6984 RepID=A0AAD8E8F2_DIPPU|nr:hypothetical protein L9F63_024339 [Diploptera punctata]
MLDNNDKNKMATPQQRAQTVSWYVKDRLFATPVQDLHGLRTHILHTIATLPKDMLDRTWYKIEHTLDIVRATNGAHIDMFCCVAMCGIENSCQDGGRSRE